MKTFTVAELNHYVAELIKGDKSLAHVWIKGEISNFKAHSSGHLYFSLKEGGTVVKAVMFRSMASRLRFRPKDGMSVMVSAAVTVYEAGGVYQLNVWDMLPADAVGSARQELEERKKRLKEAGLFEEAAKRPLPDLPRVIGVVTSPTGAALQDILQILGRRCPVVQVRVFPVLVQGAGAPESITRALRSEAVQDCDVLILGRGGGASEDLEAFNAEHVAYAIYDCPVPVISAVGHETDFTIADAVADRRAPTPSAAAELAVPALSQLHERTDCAMRELQAAYAGVLHRQEQALDALHQRLQQCRPDHRIRLRQEECRRLTQRLESSMQLYLERRLSAYTAMQEKLTQLDPLRILQRGYAAVYHDNGSLLSSVQETAPGEELRVRLSDGSLQVKVETINEL